VKVTAADLTIAEAQPSLEVLPEEHPETAEMIQPTEGKVAEMALFEER
jgi:hypothetical protein